MIQVQGGADSAPAPAEAQSASPPPIAPGGAPPAIASEPLPPPPTGSAASVPPGAIPSATLPGAMAPSPSASLLKPPATGEVRAALLVPLSGPNAALGATLSNAAQLALFEVADAHFDLLPIDTKGTAEGSAAAAQSAVSQGANIILGPLVSQDVRAAAQVARAHAIPMLAFTTDRSVLGDGVYSLGFLPGPQVKRVVTQALADNHTRFALLAPDTDYGHAMADALKAAVLAAPQAQLVRLSFYDPAQDPTPVVKAFTDYAQMRGTLEREHNALSGRSGSQAALGAIGDGIAKTPFDAVLLPDDGTRLKNVASLLTYYGVDPRQVLLLGTMLWDDPRLASEPSLLGGWYPAPPAAAHANFAARYAKAFGPLRYGAFASTAYDAAALAATLARRGQGDYSTAVLTNPDGFAGVDGIFRLYPDGTNDRGLTVRELTKDGSREIAPAPATFVPLTQ